MEELVEPLVAEHIVPIVKRHFPCARLGLAQQHTADVALTKCPPHSELCLTQHRLSFLVILLQVLNLLRLFAPIACKAPSSHLAAQYLMSKVRSPQT